MAVAGTLHPNAAMDLFERGGKSALEEAIAARSSRTGFIRGRGVRPRLLLPRAEQQILRLRLSRKRAKLRSGQALGHPASVEFAAQVSFAYLGHPGRFSFQASE